MLWWKMYQKKKEGQEKMTIEISTPILIDVDCLHPNEWNPNYQTDETFNQLVDEIKEDGFEQPLNVVPADEIEGVLQYTIIGGEHRWKAARVLGLEQIPCYVHHNWDEAAQKLKTVRRNLMTGQLDDVKFTAMVKDLEDRFKISEEDLPKLLGFEDSREFAKHYVEEKEGADRSFIDALLHEAKKESHAVDSVVDVISNIFAEAGDTIDQDFLHFSYRGSIQTVILCDSECIKSVKGMVDHLKDEGGTATKFLSEAISSHLSIDEEPSEEPNEEPNE